MSTDNTMQQPSSAYSAVFEFEEKLAEYTGAPYAIVMDCCTHAIELSLRWDKVTECGCEKHTYLSIPMKIGRAHV